MGYLDRTIRAVRLDPDGNTIFGGGRGEPLGVDGKKMDVEENFDNNINNRNKNINGRNVVLHKK